MIPPSALDSHLGYRLRQLSNHVSAAFAARLEKHDVSVAQWVVLRVLYDGNEAPLSLKDLAARLGGDPGALSRMIERLIARGLVVRAANPADRRGVALSLTREGRQLVPKLAREADENDKAFFDALPATQRKAFLAAIDALLARNRSEDRGIPLQ